MNGEVARATGSVKRPVWPLVMPWNRPKKSVTDWTITATVSRMKGAVKTIIRVLKMHVSEKMGAALRLSSAWSVRMATYVRPVTTAKRVSV
jgi:hypothetical protein